MTTPAPRLLVVDDNEDNRYTLTQRLKRQGYTNVAVAVNGVQALEMLNAESFDLVLLDVMMPELNGYEVLERLKADERLRHIPVIMISAVDQLESVVRCVELGADDYLAKPFNPTLLKARVGASLLKKRLRDEIAAQLARVEGELDSAREIQLGMVPDDFSAVASTALAQIFATLQPAREVGGDLYDFFQVDAETLGFVIADVSGKGAAAALFMAHTSSMIRVVASLLRTPDGGASSPADVITRVNEELCRTNRGGMFVTLFFAALDLPTGQLSFCSAGHPAPYVVSQAKGVMPVEGPNGIPLGIEAAFEYETGTHALAGGDCLFLYTDGVTEAMDSDSGFYTDARLRETLRALAGASPSEIVEGVVSSVRAFAGGAPQADDVAAMAVRLAHGGVVPQ